MLKFKDVSYNVLKEKVIKKDKQFISEGYRSITPLDLAELILILRHKDFYTMLDDNLFYDILNIVNKLEFNYNDPSTVTDLVGFPISLEKKIETIIYEYAKFNLGLDDDELDFYF